MCRFLPLDQEDMSILVYPIAQQVMGSCHGNTQPILSGSSRPLRGLTQRCSQPTTSSSEDSRPQLVDSKGKVETEIGGKVTGKGGEYKKGTHMMVGGNRRRWISHWLGEKYVENHMGEGIVSMVIRVYFAKLLLS